MKIENGEKSEVLKGLDFHFRWSTTCGLANTIVLPFQVAVARSPFVPQVDDLRMS
jgi:hypothetical protein